MNCGSVTSECDADGTATGFAVREWTKEGLVRRAMPNSQLLSRSSHVLGKQRCVTR